MSISAQNRPATPRYLQPAFVGVVGIGAFVVAGLLILVAVIVAGQAARRDAVDDIRRQAESIMVLDRALLASELDRHRATPVVLASDEAIVEALLNPDPDRLARVNARLEALASQTGAAAIYLLDRRGTAIAANNFRTPLSFVGTDYAYRPYFQAAMQTGSDEYFALGSVSGRPGLYLARRMRSGQTPLGVVVVKVELNPVEDAWRRQTGQAMVADHDGVILLTSDPARRFRTLTPLSPDTQRALRETRQFGEAPLSALDPQLAGGDGSLVRIDGEVFMQLRRTLPLEDWTIVLLAPIADADKAAAPVRWATGLAGGLVMVVLAWIWRSHLRGIERRHLETEARRELEFRVDERTTALTEANVRLKGEIDDRKRAEARLRALQADLVQANRMAHLGQIVAGVAHEINQPVAAIRANADNALTLLSRDQGEEAQVKLSRIQGLTERIGSIVEDLRGFARKAPTRTTPISVDEAIEGALLLVSSRMRGDRIAVERAGVTGLQVMGDRVRLEQVLVNLLQNAFEALEDRADGRISLDVTANDEAVIVAVADNGSGLSAKTRRNLFTPFSTTKPNGLGLGLVISKDIVEALGGSLTVDPDWKPGARFLIQLRRRPS